MNLAVIFTIISVFTNTHPDVYERALRPLPFLQRVRPSDQKPNEWTVSSITAMREQMKIAVHEVVAMLRHVDIEFKRLDDLIEGFPTRNYAMAFGSRYISAMDALNTWYYRQNEDPALSAETANAIGTLLTSRLQRLLTELNGLTVSMGVFVQELRALPESNNSGAINLSAEMIEDQIYNARDRVSSFASAGQYDTRGNPVPCDLNESIRRMLTYFIMTTAAANSLDIKFHPSDNLPLAQIDQGLASEIWANLVRNAAEAVVQAEKMKGPSKRTPPAKVNLDITTMRADNHILIIFADNGPGIPQENFSKIFELFWTTKNDMGGTGVGLALVKKIINDAGGTITVGSNTPTGARFMIMLPAMPAPARPPSKAAAMSLLSGV